MKFLVTGGTGFIGGPVVRNLLDRGFQVVIGEVSVNEGVAATLTSADVMQMDVSDDRAITAVFGKHPDITHCIHLAYLMSAEIEANPILGVKVDVLGMVNMFEAAARHKLTRLVFASSETVYGASQKAYGERAVKEDDFCSPAGHFFTYGVMKILNEFMAQKYVARHGISIVCTRPAIVFGHGRKRGSLLWAEAFATQPALGKPTELPFSAISRDTYIYKDDCAEQMIRLALKPQLSHFVYNNGGACASGEEMAATVRHWIPDAAITFDESKPGTPLIDWQDGHRLEEEIQFEPRSLSEGVRAHINQARTDAGLHPL